MSHVSHEQVDRMWVEINGSAARFRSEQARKTSGPAASVIGREESTGITYPTNTTKTGDGMSYRLEQQVELLNDAKRGYQGLSERIQELIAESKRIVANLADNELNHDFVEYLEEFNSTLAPAMAHAVEQIDEHLQGNLSSKIRYLEERERG